MPGPGVPQGNPPPTLSTFWRTIGPALRERALFREVQTYCMFIGMNRSGSSLVGSLLNAHRHALIAHELNALHFIKRRFTRLQLYWLLRQQDQAFESADRQWYGYDYRVAGQWQGRSERLLVMGDKHAGGATHILGQRPDLLARLMRTVGIPVKMIHVVRNPLDNIATVHRLQNLTLEAAADYHFEHAATNARLMREHPQDVRTVHLEDVIREPAREMHRLCGFLGLDAPLEYLRACTATVFSEPRRTRTGLAWPPELIERILERCRPIDFLQRYLVDMAHFARQQPAARSRAAA